MIKLGQLAPPITNISIYLLGCFCRGKMRCHGVLFVSTAAALLFYFPHTRCRVLQSTHDLQCLQQSWRRKLNIFPASNSCHDAQTRIYLFCSGFQPGSKLSKVNNSHEVLCPDQAMSDAGLHKQRGSPRHSADGLNIVVTASVIIITTSLIL